MSHSKKQEKTSDSVKSGGLTPSQTQHLVMGYLCMEKSKQVDWKKLGELCNVSTSSARTVFTKARRRLEKWEEQIAAAAAIKEVEEAGEAREAGETGEDEGDNKDSDEAVEAAHAQDAEN
ncbi:hypothetical protein PENSOL_c002G02495 [Penicillium solitum]|uniref:Uncharacterized protein n=1 Tax=Penicillium solitum TaxID=60172 RepID=A0A1V6RKM1_9EURO|nr:uncharacterized protein PENSOL_c002G02495 [Penicillium solitum]OQE02382.1 hypothetical protein PENSOL_c002G02495 [Penicillium solitum]